MVACDGAVIVHEVIAFWNWTASPAKAFRVGTVLWT
jgi:hypothetical protein